MVSSSHVEVVEGTVEAVNERGVRIKGNWYNVSKFRAVELPSVGARAALDIDTKGFILDVKMLDGSLPAPSSSEPRLEPATNLRLEVLKAAAAFCGAKAAASSDVKSTDVLKIAESWLAWVEGR